MCAVLWGGEFVPDAGLLQGQTQAGQSPLQVHTQGQVVLEKTPYYHLGGERHIQGWKMWLDSECKVGAHKYFCLFMILF